MAAVAPVLSALADPTRWELVATLGARGPLTVTALTAGTRLTRQGVSKHLDVLAGAGIASSERHGRERRWRLHPAALAEAGSELLAASQRWDAALERLRDFVEE